MSAEVRKIIHCDCDCFYAAVEMRDDPRLRALPLAVGGAAGQRGVVATCNYEARRFGVRSAMPTAQALRLCPGLQVLRPDMEKYRQASRQILSIYRDYTDLVEPLSLDEAYLDVSNAPHRHGSATLIAQEIRRRIAAEVGITASAGVAPNKFLAKVASDWNKPDGLFVILPQQVDEFVAALPVQRLFGVGKVMTEKLHARAIRTCGDVRGLSLTALQQQFGRLGENLYWLCRGIDRRAVCPESPRKSVSVETTYARDLPHLSACQAELPQLFAALQARAGRAGALEHIHKLYVKLRFSNFRITTVECVGRQLDAATYADLLAAGYRRGGLPVRLLGLGVRLQDEASAAQLDLFA